MYVCVHTMYNANNSAHSVLNASTANWCAQTNALSSSAFGSARPSWNSSQIAGFCAKLHCFLFTYVSGFWRHQKLTSMHPAFQQPPDKGETQHVHHVAFCKITFSANGHATSSKPHSAAYISAVLPASPFASTIHSHPLCLISYSDSPKGPKASIHRSLLQICTMSSNVNQSVPPWQVLRHGTKMLFWFTTKSVQ